MSKAPTPPRRSPLKAHSSMPDLLRIEQEVNELDRQARVFKPDEMVEDAMSRGYSLVEHGLQAMDEQVDVMYQSLAQSEGRDKLFKLGQNLCKVGEYFLRTYWARAAPASLQWVSPEWAPRLKTMQSATSLTRKYLKLFGVFTFVRLFVRVYRLEKFSFLKMLVLGRFAGFTMYFAMNDLTWARKVTMITGAPAKTYSILGLKGYVLAAACTLAMDFRTLWKNHFETLHLFKRLARCDVVRRKVSATDSSSRKLASTTQSVRMKLIKKIESKRNQRRRTLVHLLKESVDAMGAVEVVMELGWTDGQSGLLSCLSASLGIRDHWVRTWRESRDKKIMKKRERDLQAYEEARKKAMMQQLSPRQQRLQQQQQWVQQRRSSTPTLSNTPTSMEEGKGEDNGDAEDGGLDVEGEDQ